jgi:hypothetical protein
MNTLHLFVGWPGTGFPLIHRFFSRNETIFALNDKNLTHALFDPALPLSKSLMGYKYDQIRCLALLRNPVEHCYSLWVESVKNGNVTNADTLQDAFRTYDYPNRLLYWLEEIRKEKLLDISVLNYSICSTDVYSQVADWLDMEVTGFQLPELFQESRELTFSEITFLRALRSAGFERFDEVLALMMRTAHTFPVQACYPESSIQEGMWIRNKASIEVLNTWALPGHLLYFDEKLHDPEMSNNQLMDRILFYQLHDMLMEPHIKENVNQ